MTKALRLLMIEDSEEDVLLTIQSLTRGGYSTYYKRVNNGEDMKAALKSKEWDVIIAGHTLHNFSAFEALNILQQSEADIPFVFVSEPLNKAITKNNLDWLVKTVKRELLKNEEQKTQK